MSRNDFGTKQHDDFGKRLRALVDAAGLTVDAFAKALGVHRDTPQKWFADQSFPHRKYHHRIAEIVHVPVGELFFSGAYSVRPEQLSKISENTELLDVYRELNKLRKNLERSKERIRELEKLVLVYESRHSRDKRKGDSSEVNPIKLRRPISFNNH